MKPLSQAPGKHDLGCPICGPVGSYPITAEDGVVVGRCKGCGLVQVTSGRNARRAQDFFREEFIRDSQTLEIRYTRERLRTLDREARRLRQLVPNGGRLLDVGTASGAFLHCFSKCTNWVVEGVEPSRFAAKYAKVAFGLTIHEGFLIEQHFPASSFDAVTCIDTFYYIPDPKSELNEIARILKVAGILAIEIPGYRFRMIKNRGLLSRLIYKRTASLDPTRHLYFYSRKTLTRLAEPHGLKFVASFPEQSPLYGPFWMQWLNSAYFRLSVGVYHITRGHINLAPKEFIVFKKVIH